MPGAHSSMYCCLEFYLLIPVFWDWNTCIPLLSPILLKSVLLWGSSKRWYTMEGLQLKMFWHQLLPKSWVNDIAVCIYHLLSYPVLPFSVLSGPRVFCFPLPLFPPQYFPPDPRQEMWETILWKEITFIPIPFYQSIRVDHKLLHTQVEGSIWNLGR